MAQRLRLMEDQEPGTISLLLAIIDEELEVPSSIPVSSFLLLAAMQHEINRLDLIIDKQAYDERSTEGIKASFLRRHAAVLCSLESVAFITPDGD